MQKLEPRQIIILIAFCLPLFSLVARFCVEVKHETVPNSIKNKIIVSHSKLPSISGGSLTDERERFKKLLAEAMKMTPQEYFEKKKTDPTFLAPTLDIRRERLAQRLEQLDQLTDEQWDADQLRQPNIISKAKELPVKPQVITVPLKH